MTAPQQHIIITDRRPSLKMFLTYYLYLVKKILHKIKRTAHERGVFAVMSAPRSVPFFSQEKIANISVLNTVSAHVDLIKRNHILRKVVADIIIRTEFTVDSLL